MIDLFLSTQHPAHAAAPPAHQFTVQDYADLLRRRWHKAVIYVPEGSTYLLRWHLHDSEPVGVSGGLHGDAATVDFGVSSLSGALDYIVWHRSLIPSAIALYLFDANFELFDPIHNDTSQADIQTRICAVFRC